MVKMRILLVYLDIDVPQNRRFSFGLGYIVSYLKSIGHELHVSVASRHSDIETIIEKIRHISPALVGFSAVTDQFRYVEQFARKVKGVNPEITTVCGAICPEGERGKPRDYHGLWGNPPNALTGVA
jgi:hypothetical protein